MAANPLPIENNIPGTVLVNAATVTEVDVVANQQIEWQNDTLFPIHVSVQAVNGNFPFSLNTFVVPAKTNHIGTFPSVVLSGTPAAQYPFTRTGQTPMGSGKIVIKTLVPTAV
jgi:hypothetical protein